MIEKAIAKDFVLPSFQWSESLVSNIILELLAPLIMHLWLWSW